MTTKTIVTLITLLLFLAFAVTTFAGIYLTYTAVSKTTQSHESASSLKLKVGNDGIEVEVTSAVAGILITGLGIVGLLLLLKKVPVREVLGYRTQGGGGDHMGFLTTTPVLSNEENRMPLLVWWMVKKKNLFVRSNVNA